MDEVMTTSISSLPLRRCADCGTPKPLSEFSPRGRGYFSSYCKPCNSKRTSDYNRRHVDQIREKQRNYLASNPDKVKEWNQRAGRKWREKNPNYHKDQYYRHREARREACRRRYQEKRRERLEAMARYRLLRRPAAAEKFLLRIQSLIPKGIPSDVRDETAQSLMMQVLTGKISPSGIDSVLRKTIKQAWPTNFSTLSIDFPIDERGHTIGDLLEDGRSVLAGPEKPRKRSGYIKTPVRGRPRIEVDLSRVTTMRSDGKSVVEIATALNVHRNTIYRWLYEQREEL